MYDLIALNLIGFVGFHYVGPPINLESALKLLAPGKTLTVVGVDSTEFLITKWSAFFLLHVLRTR
jgi:hypothetical protein